MKKEYTIRKAQTDDAKGIHEVLLEAFEEYSDFYTPEGFSDTVLSEQFVLERMKEMTVFIAINHNGKIIGTISWKKVSEKEAHIRGMAVHTK
ncbi:MAG: GNAT family N-acetyltransferase, partial [Promethearchaeota archaeon]